MNASRQVGITALAALVSFGVAWSAVAAPLNTSLIHGTRVLPLGGSLTLLRGATALRTLTPWGTAIQIGMRLVEMGMRDASTPTPNELYVRPGKNGAQRANDGWADPAVSPATLAPKWTANNEPPVRTMFAEPEAAGVKFCSLQSGGQTFVSGSLTPNATIGAYDGDCLNGGVPVHHNPMVIATCPTGYNNPGSVPGNCTRISDSAAKWWADGVPTIEPNSSGTGWISSSRDPDATPISSNCSGANCTWTGTDEYGNPTRYQWSTAPGGGVTHQQQTQSQTSGGTTFVTEQTYSINNEGDVTNVTSTTTHNTTINNYTAPAATGEIVFPDDYARENTQQEILEELQKPLDPMDVVAVPAEIPEETIAAPGITADGPRFTAECPPPIEATVLGTVLSFSLQPMCDLAGLIAPLIVGIAWVVAARIAFQTLTV